MAADHPAAGHLRSWGAGGAAHEAEAPQQAGGAAAGEGHRDDHHVGAEPTAPRREDVTLLL